MTDLKNRAASALRTAMLIAVAVAGLAGSASAQTIDSITPAAVTVGTVLTISGTGFGDHRPKIFLARAGVKQKIKLQVLSSTDTEILVQIRAASSRKRSVSGFFDLNLRAGSPGYVVVPDAVEMALPTDLEVDRSSVGRGEIVTVSGTYLGAAKGTVQVAGLLAGLVEWNATGEAPGTVSFRVPLNAPSGLADIEIKNGIGRVVMHDAVTIEDNSSGGGGGGGSDVDPLQVVAAGAIGNTQIILQFNQQVLGGISDAESPSHYRISTEGDPTHGIPASTLLVLDAELIGDQSAVLLTTLSQSDVRYKITVTSVRDVLGRPILPPQPFGIDPSSTTFVGIAPNASDLVDTDEDGLSDAAEQRGWTIAIRRTNGNIVVRSVTSDPGDPRLAADDPRNLEAMDTDADGIGDIDELHYGIDPRNPDSDGDTLSDYRELNWIYADPANQDSDADTLDDGLEFGFFKTTPIVADSDGDQLSDPNELLVQNRDPRSADLPRHAIRIGDVFVELNVEYSFVSTRDLSAFENKTAGVTLEQNTSAELTSTDTATTEWFAKAGVNGSTSASFPDGLSAELEFTAEAGVGASGTYVQTSESKERSSAAREDTATSGASLTTGETETRSVTGARLVVPVTIANVSDVAFTMSNLEITALIPSPNDPTSLIPIATLLPEAGTSTTYNFGTIDSQRGPFRFVSNGSSINPDLIDSLLAEPKSIIFKVSNFNLVDELGRDFSFQQQDVTERTAPVVIDYGNGKVERHWIALGTGSITPFGDSADADNNGDGSVDEGDRIVFDPSGKPVGVDLVQALEEVVGLQGIDLDAGADATDPVVIRSSFAYREEAITPPDGGDPVDVRTVVRIREVGASLDQFEVWALLTKEGYDALRPFDSVFLKRSEGVTFALVVDRDQDGVTRRIETLYGTSDDPGNSDSDGDGRGDFDEIYESYIVQVSGELERDVFSNPVLPDQDGDGLDDSDEYDLGTDPRLADTDGDGACDGPGIGECTEDLFPLDRDRSGAPPLLVEYLFDSPPDDADNIVNSSASGAAFDADPTSDDCVLSVDNHKDGISNGAYLFHDPVEMSSCQDSGGGSSEFRIPNLGLGSSFSMTVWVYRKSGLTAGGWVMGQGGATGQTGWARLQVGQLQQNFPSGGFTNVGTNNRVSFVIPGNSLANSLVITDDHDLAENTWTFYAVTVVNNIGTTTASLYRNSSAGPVASTTVAGSFANPSATELFFLGGMRSLAENRFKGAIDDVRVFDGVLSQSNIYELAVE